MITMGNHGLRGGYPDFFTDGGTILSFIAGIVIVISPLYIVTYLKIRVMSGKISYDEQVIKFIARTRICYIQLCAYCLY